MEKEIRESGHQASQRTQCRQKWDERTLWRAPAVPHVVKANSKDGATASRSSITADSELQPQTCQLLDSSPGKFLELV